MPELTVADRQFLFQVQEFKMLREEISRRDNAKRNFEILTFTAVALMMGPLRALNKIWKCYGWYGLHIIMPIPIALLLMLLPVYSADQIVDRVRARDAAGLKALLSSGISPNTRETNGISGDARRGSTRRRSKLGSLWKNAVGERYADYCCAPDLQERYRLPLDLLASDVGPHLYDCNGGIWGRPTGDAERHALSLAHLGHVLISECERARSSARNPNRTAKAERLKPRERKKLAEAARKLERMLQSFGPHLWRPMNAVSQIIRPARSAVSPTPEELAPGNKEMFRQISESNISPGLLARALGEFAKNLEIIDNRRNARRPSEGRDTALAVQLVTWLRVAQGAPWSYQEGDADPKDGRPSYKVAAAFVHAALPNSTPWQNIKQRLEARRRRIA